MKQIISALTLTALITSSTAVRADHAFEYRDDWALVTRVEPIIKTINIPVQEEVCWNEEGRRHHPISSSGYFRPIDYSHPISVSHTQRCRTVTSYRTEDRTDGYRIEYRYNGQEYQTTLSYRPTSREIRVRVSVIPVAE